MADTNLVSRTVLIDRQPAVLYSALSDLRTLVEKMPEDKRGSISATEDTISVVAQGMSFGMKVMERIPFNRIKFCQNDGTPIDFQIEAFFDTVDVPDNPEADCKTSFHLELTAQLGGMLKVMLGSKLQGMLDNMVEAIAAAAEGRTPDVSSMSHFM